MREQNHSHQMPTTKPMPLPRKWKGKPLNQTRVLKGGRADPNRPRHKSGNPRCRFCGGPCFGRRTSFCKAKCSHEWRLRTSTSYMRKCVFKRDKGASVRDDPRKCLLLTSSCLHTGLRIVWNRHQEIRQACEEITTRSATRMGYIDGVAEEQETDEIDGAYSCFPAGGTLN